MISLPIFIPKKLLNSLSEKDRQKLSSILEGSRSYEIVKGNYYTNVSCYIEDYDCVKNFALGRDYDMITPIASSLQGIADLKSQADKVEKLESELREKDSIVNSIKQIKDYLKEE